MKHFKLLALLIFISLTTACSNNDDDNAASSNIIKVGENATFSMQSAIIQTSFNNTYITLTNKSEAEVAASINSNTSLSSIDVLSIRINQSSLGETTYDFSNIGDVEFIVNADIIDSELEGGVYQFYLDGVNPDYEVVSGSLSISYYAIDRIAFTFTFTRNDGTIVTGNYDGGFLNLESSER